MTTEGVKDMVAILEAIKGLEKVGEAMTKSNKELVALRLNELQWTDYVKRIAALQQAIDEKLGEMTAGISQLLVLAKLLGKYLEKQLGIDGAKSPEAPIG